MSGVTVVTLTGSRAMLEMYPEFYYGMLLTSAAVILHELGEIGKDNMSPNGVARIILDNTTKKLADLNRNLTIHATFLKSAIPYIIEDISVGVYLGKGGLMMIANALKAFQLSEIDTTRGWDTTNSMLAKKAETLS